MKSVRLNNIGTTFKITIKDQDSLIVPIETSSIKRLYFKRPDRTVFYVNASFFTDGTDGIIIYRTIQGDLNQTGIWEIEPYIVIYSGHFTGSSIKFIVKDIIN